MAPVLKFDHKPTGKKTSFIIMTYNDKELDDVKETDYFVSIGD